VVTHIVIDLSRAHYSTGVFLLKRQGANDMKTQTLDPTTRARLQQLSYPRLLWVWLRIWLIARKATVKQYTWLIGASVAYALVMVLAGIGLATVVHVLVR
jgi:hypothetical protein